MVLFCGGLVEIYLELAELALAGICVRLRAAHQEIAIQQRHHSVRIANRAAYLCEYTLRQGRVIFGEAQITLSSI